MIRALKLLEAERNGVSITSAQNVRIDHDTIAGAGGRRRRGIPGDGIDVEPNTRADPIVALRIEHDRIVGNLREGIALRLKPRGRPSLRASAISITHDELLANAQS